MKIKNSIFNKYKFILLFLIFLFCLIIYYYKYYQVKEHYLTYFLPYTTDIKDDLYNFYSNKYNETLYYKSNIDYNVIKIGTVYESPFSEYLIKIFLSNTNLLNANIIRYPNREISLDELINGKINLLVVDYITIFYYKYILNKDISDLRLVTHLNKEYIYTFVKKNSKITSINDFPPNCNIGTLDNPNSLHYYIDKLLLDMDYQKDVDYNLHLYPNINILFENFIESKLDVIILSSTFPDNNLNKIISNNIHSNIILLPFDIKNEKVFFQKNTFLYTDYVDLNDFYTGYLPVKFGKYHYNVNLPNIKLCYFNKLMITTHDIKSSYTYNIIKYYNENIDVFNKNNSLGLKLDKKYFRLNEYIPFHEGVIKYLKEKGYASNNNNPNCKYLVGVSECTDETLKRNNLYYTL